MRGADRRGPRLDRWLRSRHRPIGRPRSPLGLAHEERALEGDPGASQSAMTSGADRHLKRAAFAQQQPATASRGRPEAKRCPLFAVAVCRLPSAVTRPNASYSLHFNISCRRLRGSHECLRRRDSYRRPQRQDTARSCSVPCTVAAAPAAIANRRTTVPTSVCPLGERSHPLLSPTRLSFATTLNASPPPCRAPLPCGTSSAAPQMPRRSKPRTKLRSLTTPLPIASLLEHPRMD